MSLGKRLKYEREKRNWSQKYVADKIGITNTVLSNYERDYRDPDTTTLKKLADLYEVSTDYLLGKTDKPTYGDNKEYDSLAEINKLVKEYGIGDFGFFDIEKWKNLSPEDVDEIRRHFEWITQRAKERNEEKE